MNWIIPSSKNILKPNGFLIFFFWINFLAAQNTKEVIRKFPDSKQVSEKMDVLRSNDTLCHGEYRAYFKATKEEYTKLKKEELSIDRFIRVKGQYQMNKKDGEWIEYYSPGEIKSKSYYKNGQKVGIWFVYKEKGEVVERYDHDHQKRLTPLISIPVKNIRPPHDSIPGGVVSFSFSVSKDCSIRQWKMMDSLSKEHNKEAEFVFQKYIAYNKRYCEGLKCEAKQDTFVVAFRPKK